MRATAGIGALFGKVGLVEEFHGSATSSVDPCSFPGILWSGGKNSAQGIRPPTHTAETPIFAEIPCFFPANREVALETSSPKTASPANIFRAPWARRYTQSAAVAIARAVTVAMQQASASQI
jgi:hypothetical protein